MKKQENLKNFGARVKKARLSKDWSQEELANKLGTSKSVISGYESGRNDPAYSMALKIAEKLNVSINWLFYGNEDFSNITNAINPPSTKQYPLIGTIAAGVPVLAEENIEEYISLDKKINADFCLRVSGDSMVLSYIFDGDIVFIRQQPDVENGEIAAVLIDDSATLKKVYKHGNDVVELRAENPKYKPMLFDNHSNISIIGKAVYKLSKI